MTYTYEWRSATAIIFKDDPGPCVVDDAPHTTCCSAEYRGGPVAVIPQTPARDLLAAAPAAGSNAASVPSPTPPTISVRRTRRRRV